jgi:hypothetical protein
VLKETNLSYPPLWIAEKHINNIIAAFFYVSRKILPDNVTVNLLVQKGP